MEHWKIHFRCVRCFEILFTVKMHIPWLHNIAMTASFIWLTYHVNIGEVVPRNLKMVSLDYEYHVADRKFNEPVRKFDLNFNAVEINKLKLSNLLTGRKRTPRNVKSSILCSKHRYVFMCFRSVASACDFFETVVNTTPIVDNWRYKLFCYSIAAGSNLLMLRHLYVFSCQ